MIINWIIEPQTEKYQKEAKQINDTIALAQAYHLVEKIKLNRFRLENFELSNKVFYEYANNINHFQRLKYKH